MTVTKLALTFAGMMGTVLTLLVGGMGSAGGTWLRGDEIAYVSYHHYDADIFVIDLNHMLTYNLTRDSAYDTAPSWSPNGEWIAFASDRDGRRNIYVMDRFGRDIRRLTDSDGVYTQPRWTADGKSLIFIALNHAPTGVYRIDADGSNFERLNDPANPRAIRPYDLAYDPGDISRAFSPDGSRMAFMRYSNKAWGIYVSPNSSRRDARLLVDVGRFTEPPAWSPDGTRMAYTAQRDGAVDLFIIDVDGSSTPRRLTFNRELDVSPAWRP